MKKILSIFALAAAMSLSASAQGLGDLLGGLTSNSTVNDILGSLGNVIYSAPISLNGTYTYTGSAVSMTKSDGNLLSNLAGTAVTSGVEDKIDKTLSKFGVKPGVTTFTFNATDESFTCNVMGLPLNGTYKVGTGEKTVTLTFGRKLKYFSMTGTLESVSGGFKMLFPANKLLGFLKKCASVAGQRSSEIAAIASLADGYDTFKVGFTLIKQ